MSKPGRQWGLWQESQPGAERPNDHGGAAGREQRKLRWVGVPASPLMRKRWPIWPYKGLISSLTNSSLSLSGSPSPM